MDHEDGCPTTGWFYESSNTEYDSCMQSIESIVAAYAELPDADTAFKLWNGGPW